MHPFCAWLLVVLPPVCSRPPALPLPWLDSGHKTVALIAWAELTPAARAKVTAILQQHPLFEQDLLRGLAEGADAAARSRHAFAVAATWPDVVRGMGHPMHKQCDHPPWHYINIPYAIEDQPVPAATRSDKPGPHDVVEALQQVIAELRAGNGPAADQAIAICWLLHLVGDIHQPLHACTLYSPQFPNGDQGGIGFLVLRDPPYGNSQMNLHLLWDSLPGTFKSDDLDGYLAGGLRADPRFARDRLHALLAVHDVAAWAQESHALAIEHAYLKGALKGAVAHEQRGEGKAEIPGVPRGYLEQAEPVAMQRVLLAGYRAADLLNAMFDRK